LADERSRIEFQFPEFGQDEFAFAITDRLLFLLANDDSAQDVILLLHFFPLGGGRRRISLDLRKRFGLSFQLVLEVAHLLLVSCALFLRFRELLIGRVNVFLEQSDLVFPLHAFAIQASDRLLRVFKLRHERGIAGDELVDAFLRLFHFGDLLQGGVPLLTYLFQFTFDPGQLR
jgi:hypothetical protein